jgi:hypothetical protein
MGKLKTIIIFTLVVLCLTGCSWGVNLIIANITQSEVIIKYTFPKNDVDSQFFKIPDTYIFNDSLAKLYRKTAKVVKLESNYSYSLDSLSISVIIKPGQAIHIGRYGASYESVDSLLSKYHFIIETGEGTATNFKHWKNMHTDLLTVQ